MVEEDKPLPASTPINQLKLQHNEKAVLIEVSLSEYGELIQFHLNTQRLHIGYYENGQDIEAIAFKDENGFWEVFFQDEEDTRLFESNEQRDEDFGVSLFKTKTEKEAHDTFFEWVEEVLLPFRERDKK